MKSLMATPFLVCSLTVTVQLLLKPGKEQEKGIKISKWIVGWTIFIYRASISLPDPDLRALWFLNFDINIISNLNRKELLFHCVCLSVCLSVCMLSHVRLLVTPWAVARQAPLFNSPGKNTGAGFHFLTQGIFPIQESNSCLLHLLHWQVDSLPLCYLGFPLFHFRGGKTC